MPSVPERSSGHRLSRQRAEPVRPWPENRPGGKDSKDIILCGIIPLTDVNGKTTYETKAYEKTAQKTLSAGSARQDRQTFYWMDCQTMARRLRPCDSTGNSCWQ